MKNGKITKEQFENKWDLKGETYEDKLNPIKIKADKLYIDAQILTKNIEKLGGNSWGSKSLYYELFESWDKKEEERQRKEKEEIAKKEAERLELLRVKNET